MKKKTRKARATEKLRKWQENNIILQNTRLELILNRPRLSQLENDNK